MHSGLSYFAESCTSGRAGGLICEPLKAVWPAYAGIVTRIFLVDRASYLLSLVPLCTLESGLHPAPPLTRNSPSPKVLSHKVLRSIHEIPSYRDCTLALDNPHHPRDRVLRWYRQQHVNMVCHQMPLLHYALFLLS